MKNSAKAKVPITRKKRTPNQWTVMVYMAGDNTLAGESVWALTEIQSVAFGDGVEAIALFDSAPSEVKTQRFLFNQKTPKTLPNGQPVLLEDVGEPFQLQIPVKKKADKKAKPEIVESASDFQLLQHFLTTTMTEHPAEKNLLVLSGHGSGAVGDFLTSDNAKGSLSIPHLQQVLSAVKKETLKRKIDILGMDSCLMGMVEVCYEVRQAVELLVGSEGFEPETGWPYRQILDALNRNPTMGPNQLAETIVAAYIAYYKNFSMAGISLDQAVCDLTQMDKLAAAMRKLAERMTAQLANPAVQNAILLAHWRAQAYKSEQYVDLWDFCDLLQANCPVAEIANACIEVQSILKSDVVQQADYYGPAFQHSHGLSIFFPWRDSESLQQYCQGLSFAKETKWGNFLKEYVKQTQRKMRGDHRSSAKGKLDSSLEVVEITAAESPIIIPVLSDLPADKRVPPGGDRVPPGGDRVPPGGDRVPPGGDRGMAKRGVMKNPPRFFIRNKKTKKAVQ